MKINMKVTIDLAHGQTAGELAEIMASLPAEGRVSVRQDKYYDPRDTGGTWIDVTWTEER